MFQSSLTFGFVSLLALTACGGGSASHNLSGGSGTNVLPPRLDIFADKTVVGPQGVVSLQGYYSSGSGSWMEWSASTGIVTRNSWNTATWTASNSYGDATITAASDTGLFKGSKVIRIVPIQVSFAQGTSITLSASGPVYLQAQVNPDQGNLDWEAPLGTIQGPQPRSASFIPPTAPGTYQITARSVDDPTGVATLSVTIKP